MITGQLSNDKDLSPEFLFSGECYVCVKGEGTLTVERNVGTGFEVMTMDDGVPMIFVGDGIVFNGTLRANKKMAYRLRFNGTAKYTISAEER